MLTLQGGHRFIHVPKTGGTFVYEAIKKLGIPHKGEPFQHDQLIGKKNGSYLTCIREPVSWMKSLYFFRKKHNWNWMNRELENKCKADTLEGFFRNLCKPENENIVLHYYEYFLGKAERAGITYLQTKKLNAELCDFLESHNIPFDKEKLLSMEKVGVNKRSNKGLLSKELEESFIENNASFYLKYGSLLK